MKKILVLYGSVGLGHKVVAENIAAALRLHPELEIEMLDVLKLYEGALTRTSARIYEWIIKHIPGLWGFFYTNKVFLRLTLPLRLPLASLKAEKLKHYLLRIKPDLVLTTHPTPTALMSHFKKQQVFTGPLVATFSDFHFQPYWVYPRVDRYLVMTPEQKEEVMKLGFSGKRIIITGLPADLEFAREVAAREVFQEFKISRTKPLVLVMGGSRGWGVSLKDIAVLLESPFDMEIAVITGINPELEQKLRELAKIYPALKVFGNLPNSTVSKFFAIAKILVTKPGGLTIAQALLRTLPMVLVNPLPAMEERNADYLTKRGVAVRARTPKELMAWVERLLTDRKFYQKIKEQMKTLRSPDAASRAAGAIIDMLP